MNNYDFYQSIGFKYSRLKRCRSSPFILYAKLMFWMTKSILANFIGCCRVSKRFSGPELKIAFILPGGIGDIVINSILVDRISKRISKDTKLFLIGGPILDIFFGGRMGVAGILRDLKNARMDFDCIVEVNVNFPAIIFERRGLNLDSDPFLKTYIDAVKRFHLNYSGMDNSENCVQQLLFMAAVGKNRISALDVGGVLGIGNDDLWDLRLSDVDEREVKRKFGFLNGAFITVGRGVDANNQYADSIRLWSVEKYNEWISIFKTKFPNIPVVQLGSSVERCKSLNVDINLVGKTSLLDLLVILKYSMLHLDGECGYVHLRHFLTAAKGRSLVLFGPTSEKLRGYQENFNVVAKRCQEPFCEWAAGRQWQACCMKTGSTSPQCVNGISPMDAFERVFEYLNSALS